MTGPVQIIVTEKFSAIFPAYTAGNTHQHSSTNRPFGSSDECGVSMQEYGPFLPLSVSSMSLVEKNDKHYRVYKDPKEFVLIEASTAYEAIQKSTIPAPYKVEHVFYEPTGIKNAEDLLLIESSKAAMEMPSEKDANEAVVEKREDPTITEEANPPTQKASPAEPLESTPETLEENA